MSTDDWDQRMVCPDGNCIGVVGVEGKCNVCGHTVDAGRPRDSDNPGCAGVRSTPVKEVRSWIDADCCASAAVPAEHVDPVEDHSDDWNRRRLCSDGGCIGLIADDGRCSSCGKPA